MPPEALRVLLKPRERREMIISGERAAVEGLQVGSCYPAADEVAGVIHWEGADCGGFGPHREAYPPRLRHLQRTTAA